VIGGACSTQWKDKDKILLMNLTGKRKRRETRRRRKHDIMTIEEGECENVGWIKLAQDSVGGGRI
jgi:hypothetical protein